jgi:hypothetical protein
MAQRRHASNRQPPRRFCRVVGTYPSATCAADAPEAQPDAPAMAAIANTAVAWRQGGVLTAAARLIAEAEPHDLLRRFDIAGRLERWIAEQHCQAAPDGWSRSPAVSS